jgi:hypothetical protein
MPSVRSALAGADERDENGLVVPLLPDGDRDAMNAGARTTQRIYLALTLGNTLAASFIWGINTLFLLDAGQRPDQDVERGTTAVVDVLFPFQTSSSATITSSCPSSVKRLPGTGAGR